MLFTPAPPLGESARFFFSETKRSSGSSAKATATTATTTSTATTNTTVTVVTRRIKAPASSHSSSTSSSSTPSSSDPARIARLPTKKRRSPSPGAAPGPSKVPKTRATSRATSARSSRASSRMKDAPPRSPSPIYRTESRSRKAKEGGAHPEGPIPRSVSIEETGEPGEECLSSEAVVKKLIKSYESYFRNPKEPSDKAFEWHETNYPTCELQYPNTGASERFILLVPKDKDHYNPIMDLEKTVQTIVKTYLTPEQQADFGYVPNDLYLTDSDDPFGAPEVPLIPDIIPSARNTASPPPNSAHSSKPSSSVSSLSSLSSISKSSSSSALSWLSSSSSPGERNLLRRLRRAINTRNGPAFQRALSAINDLFVRYKHPPLHLDLLAPPTPNELCAAVRSWDHRGLPREVWARIIDETYQRAVGPNVPTLREYKAFSSEVYGELMPALVAELVRSSGLGPGKLFVDLGSGVGNVVLQAAIQSGCDGYGIEIMEAPAKIAAGHLVQFKERCRMWGVSAGDVEFEQGNMLENETQVTKMLAKADVVLVNNKVFDSELNQKLTGKFLDMKEGARIISLQPFSAPNARLTERNMNEMTAIFAVSEHEYHPGQVSWGSSGGTYYVHKVDRLGYAEARSKFQRVHGSRRSATARKYTPSQLDD